jgi:hypothetical protein
MSDIDHIMAKRITAPITVHARAVASLEMFVGVMYIALVVSRLIGLSVTPAPRDDS